MLEYHNEDYTEASMTYKGHVFNGTVLLDEPAEIPDGTKVEIAVYEPSQLAEDGPILPTLYERLRSVVGVVDGPADLAENHNYYAHGLPKS